MSLIRTVAPGTDVVPLDEMKGHIHVDFVDDDARITEFIRTASQRLDGRDSLIGRALITQTWELKLDGFPYGRGGHPTVSGWLTCNGEIVVPLPPCQSITSITYLDPDGAIQTLDPADYQAAGLGDANGARIRPALGKSWPATPDVAEAVTVTFIAGYGDDAADVPEPLRTAIKMHAAHLYENRESVMALSGFVGETPHGYDDLISDYRIWSF